MARGAELAEFTGLLDLLEDMLEKIAFGIGIGFIQPQPVDERHHLGKDGRLVNDQTGAIHEIDSRAFRHLQTEREHLVTNKGCQPGATHAARPYAPAQPIAGNGGLTGRRGVQRILQRPRVASEDAGEGALGGAGAIGVVLIQSLDQIEEEQERKLFCVAHRVGVAAAVEVVADLVNAPSHVSRHRHW